MVLATGLLESHSFLIILLVNRGSGMKATLQWYSETVSLWNTEHQRDAKKHSAAGWDTLANYRHKIPLPRKIGMVVSPVTLHECNEAIELK